MSIKEGQAAQLVKAIREAGSRLRSLWPGGRPAEKIEIFAKDDGSPVTSADYESNSIISSALSELFPSDPVLSEEGEKIAIPETGRIWVLDPLDGTRRFIEGKNDYCILLSLMVDGIPQEGIVYFPETELFFASFDPGTLTKCSLTSRVSPRGIYAAGLELKDIRYHYNGYLHSGSAFLKLIQGEIDAFAFDLAKPSQWDIAAPHAIITRVGGTVGTIEGKPLCYSASNWSEQVVVGSGARTHSEVLTLLL